MPSFFFCAKLAEIRAFAYPPKEEFEMKIVLCFDSRSEETICVEYTDPETCIVDLEKIITKEAELYFQRADKLSEWYRIPWPKRQTENIERPNTESYFIFADYIFDIQDFFSFPIEEVYAESSHVRDPKRGDSICLPEILSLDEWFDKKQTEQNSELIDRAKKLKDQK